MLKKHGLVLFDEWGGFFFGFVSLVLLCLFFFFFPPGFLSPTWEFSRTLHVW